MMKRALACLGILLLVTMLAACASKEEKRQKFLGKGKTLYAQADYVNATLELKNALQIDPQCAEAYYLLGQIALKQGNLRQAYGALSKAVTLNPGSLDAQLQLGKVFLAGGAPERALEKAELVLKQQPRKDEALLLKGAVLLARKEPDQAQAILTDLIQRGVQQPQTYLLLARAYAQKQDLIHSEQTLQKSAWIYPQSAELQFALAELYAKTGRLDESEAALRRIIVLQPNVIGHKLNLARLYWDSGRKDEAAKVLQTVTASKREEGYLAVSDFYLGKRQPVQAEKVLQAGLAQQPKSFKLHIALAELYQKLGQNAAAISLLQECLAIYSNPRSPQNSQTRNTLATAYLVAGDSASASRVIAEALKDNPKSSDLRFTAGRIALQQADYDKAIGDFRVVMTDKPEFIPGYLGLAEAHAKNGETALALDTLLKAQRAAPRSAEVLLALAKLYTGRQDYPQAAAALRKVEEYYPGRYAIQAELGDLSALQKDYAGAARAYRQIRDTDTRYTKLARLAAQQGQWGEALALTEEGYRLNPQNTRLLTPLVELYLRNQQLDKAAKICSARLQRNGQDALALYLQGRVAAAEKDYARAETSLHKVIQAKPDWPEPYYLLAKLSLSQGKRAEAIRGFENALAKNPKGPAPYLALGAIYEQDGNIPQARRIYEQALGAIPNLWPAVNNLAFILSEHAGNKADLDRALALARQAQRSRPDDPAVMDTLGWVHFKRGELQPAQAAIQSALDKDQQNAIFNYHMGMILARTGKKTAAVEHLQAALQSGSAFRGRAEAETALKRIQP